jgi:hypothetical protein
MVREDWVGGLEVVETTELMSLATLAQISMFLLKERRMGRMVSLYAGSRDGFSMGMFESTVLKYPGTSPPNPLIKGPSILLMRRTTVGAYTHLPGTHQDKEVIFGVYISTPWKSSANDTLHLYTLLYPRNVQRQSVPIISTNPNPHSLPLSLLPHPIRLLQPEPNRSLLQFSTPPHPSGCVELQSPRPP